MLASSQAGSIFNLSEEVISCGSSHGSARELLLTPKEIEKKLNVIEDQLVDDPQNISYDSLYFEVKELINSYSELSTGSKLKLVGFIQSSFSKYIQELKTAMSAGKNSFEATQWRSSCEMYVVLVLQIVLAAEGLGSEKGKAVPTTKARASISSTAFDYSHIRIALLENMKLLAALSLGRLFDSSMERESVANCLVKASHKILENAENVKNFNTKKAALDVLCECARSQGYSHGLKTILLQDLIYFEHLAEPVAELLKLLYGTEDAGCAQSCEEILKSMGSHRFSSQESTISTKIAAIFFAKFASICPKEAHQTLALFIDQLDSEAYVIRMAMIEVIGVLVFYLMNQEDRSDTVKAQTKSLFVALEERFNDVNAFVRSKTLQVCCDLARSASIPINKRPKLLKLASQRVMDKSSNVRRKAIQLLGDFLKTHPFGVDGGELNLSFFQSRLTDVDRLLSELSSSELQENHAMEVDRDEDGDDGAEEERSLLRKSMSASMVEAAHIGTLLAQKQYYTDAIKFVTLINEVIPTICLLLSSTTKTEVFDVMEFLVEAHIYKLETADAGLRKMLHLIWERELSSEDGTKQSIREHLIENYRKIYLYADDRLSVKERSHEIARNLIRLVDAITIAELASLSELFSSFMKKNLVSEGVVHQVFAIFASNEFDPCARRSALIILSILGRSKREIVEKRLDGIIKLGLGSLGQVDPLIAQFTFKALQSLSGNDSITAFSARIPHENVLFERIFNFIETTCNTPQWFSVLNEAIVTIFALADRPGALCAQLLCSQAREVFQGNDGRLNVNFCGKDQLCKLLLLIGQVASCYTDHLELIERHGKDSAQRFDASRASGADADLAKVSASAEEDFSELVKGVREHEILFGPQSILTTLGPVVTFICSNNLDFPDCRLQRIATLSLAKLMTVSSVFCEQNLQLFLTILEKSSDAVIRSNMIIAFGDLAQSFNRLVDQNIEYLFSRLRDVELKVRRNTLMVLTHLSLCGMIKVKGQIAEIAKCLIDSDERIRNLARIFFSEMAERDSGSTSSNGIYNHIPDILSNLTGIDEESFQTIMKFIFDFIRKERQMENLIEKLCARFRLSDSPRHARDVAFCLGLISFSGDRSLKKLIEAFPLYQDKLVDDFVMGSFVEIVNRSKKFCKAECKALLDEFESRLLKAANGNLERETDSSHGSGGVISSFAALSQSISQQRRATANSTANRTKPSTRRKPTRKPRETFSVEDDDDEEFDEEFVEEHDAESHVGKTSKSRTSTRKAAVSGRKHYEDEASDQEASNEVVSTGSLRKKTNPNSRRKIIHDEGEDDEDIF